MLDTATKRRIDTARDILVGKIPDPKSQVEQITIALIYKFMDDMDAEAEELGGKRSFFAGDFARFGWAKLMRSGLGGHEMLNLYAEAITRMPENPGVPALFRDIFKNAFLPYRDPETLRAFLKIIDEFEYDHSERLGDAFEYLLSVLGSQGDAGQFRTPRHIIDFIVEIVDPKKDETILDPACGTAGFLISAWKHIQAANRDANGESKLTPDEQERIATNIKGYDISPDMVRLSLANMYLHGFTDPHIVEYDALTSEDRWNEFADVILANPPFMTPKGGIRPHNRFSIQSNRSEVLFLDYIAEHLTPNGRAGVIVPEGVIFQSGKAYKSLRKELVEKYLVAVISLPSGVFQPYTGVKTSILIFDKQSVRQGRKILFSTVRDIGVSLGIKRTKTDKNDLPAILSDVRARSDSDLSEHSWFADRDDIARHEWNLSGHLYRPKGREEEVMLVPLGEVCTITKGNASSTKTAPGDYPLFVTAALPLTSSAYQFDGPHVCVPLISATGHGRASIKRIHYADGKFALANLLAAVAPNDRDILLPKFLHLILDSSKDNLAALMQGAANVSMKPADLAQFEIPLPPLHVQSEVIEEIEGYRKVIQGARAVVESYRPHIAVDPAWPMLPLGEIGSVESGFGFPLDRQGRSGEPIPFLKVSDMNLPGNEVHIVNQNHTVTLADVKELRAKVFPAGTVIFPKIGAAIATNKKRILSRASTYDNNVMGIVPDTAQLTSEFLYNYLVGFDLSEWASTAEPPSMKKSTVEAERIPVPPLETQRAIVAELEAERSLVQGNRELIVRMQSRIDAAIARVWGGAAVERYERIAAE